jgi:hypothetical protein
MGGMVLAFVHVGKRRTIDGASRTTGKDSTRCHAKTSGMWLRIVD